MSKNFVKSYRLSDDSKWYLREDIIRENQKALTLFSLWNNYFEFGFVVFAFVLASAGWGTQ